MARRRGRRRNFRKRARAAGRRAKRRIKSGVRSQWGKISNLAGGVVFLAQITSKDRQFYTGKTKGDQLKQLANNVLGRAIGINPFDDQQKFPQTINIDGIANKYVGAGIAGIIYGSLPIRALPHKAKVKRLAKSVLTGGFIGGLLDGPENDTRNRVLSQRISTPMPMLSSHNMNQVSTS